MYIHKIHNAYYTYNKHVRRLYGQCSCYPNCSVINFKHSCLCFRPRHFAEEQVHRISTLFVTLLLVASLDLFLPAPADSAADSAADRFLFRVSQGGDGIQSRGVWGGIAPSSTTGEASDLFSVGLALGNASDATTNLSAEVLTYDDVTRRIYVSVRRREIPDVYSASLCTDSSPMVLRPVLVNVRLVDGHHVYLMDRACGWKCGWGPFGVHDGKVYFILSAVLGDDPSRLVRQIQLRVLSGCEESIDAAANRLDPLSPHDLDILECSELISVLHTEDYLRKRPRPTMWAAGNMVVFRLQDGVSAVFQV